MTASSASLTLYETEARLGALIQALESAETDEERGAIAPLVGEYLNVAEEGRDEFVRALALLESQEALARQEIDRIRARAGVLAEIRRRMEGAAIDLMRASGATQLDGRVSVIRLRKNPPKVHLLDVTVIPQEFWKQKVKIEIDTEAISSSLKAGAVVPGAELRQGYRLKLG